jgi:hypothetical protein
VPTLMAEDVLESESKSNDKFIVCSHSIVLGSTRLGVYFNTAFCYHHYYMIADQTIY